MIPGARHSLLVQFQEQSWLAIGVEASVNDLMSVALNRIENDVKDYEMLLKIFENIPGMDQVVKRITGI